MTPHRPNHPLAAALLALPLLAALLAAAPPAAGAPTERVLAITEASANPQVPFQGFDGNPPKLFDVDGDGDLEIIAQNDNQWVYVFDSRNGALLAEVRTQLPPGWGARSFNGPEVAVLTGDGAVRLVLANSAATITSYRFDPAASTGARFSFVKEWERRLTDCFANPGMDSKPVLSDLDRDGRLEIVAATEEQGVFALRPDGRLLWKACVGGGNAEPAVGDLNGDGRPDVVFGSDGGTVTAFDGPSGATLWSFWVPGRFNVGAGSMPVGPAIGQLDGLAGPDVVVGVRDSHDATTWSNDHALLLALDSGGRLLWGRQDAQANPLTYTRPVIGDADRDGAPEVYWADWNTNGHKPPWDAAQAWKRLGPAHFYRWSATGVLDWRQTLDTWWANKDLAVADVDGDGRQEVLANGPSAGHDGIWYLDVATGAKEAFVDVHPWKVMRAPVVEDLWGGGTTQFVVAVAPNAPGSGHGLLVYDTGSPFDAVWPHPPYPVPPAASGTFDATFRISNPGEWWQQARAEPAPPRTVSKIEVRVAGGPWQAMTKQSWGDWTSSYHTTAGTRVEFLATDPGGARSQSAPFTWLDGTMTQPSVPPGDPPPPLSATFEVSPNVNEWWVEVRVEANEPLAGVDVRVDAGAWTGLSATSWGTWARSLHVVAGSTVEFRARSTAGGEAVSQPIRWLEDGTPFDAAFTPSPNANNWWVEVTVTANRGVAAVEANVDGGPWRALDATSWGTWAKSFFVASGSEVRFRATDDAGATDTSGPFVWG